jgi:two-component system, NarL family, response regulator NreC
MPLQSFPAMATHPVRLVIADDQPLFVKGFYATLQQHQGITIVGHGTNGSQLLQLVEQEQPHIVVTEITLPEMDGITAAREIKNRFPGTKVIAYTTLTDDDSISDMITEAGALGYILKNETDNALLTAITIVLNGGEYYSHKVSGRLTALLRRRQLNPKKPFTIPLFTQLQVEVLIEIARELSSKEIAQKLGKKLGAVESAKRILLAKTGCRNSVGLALYAVRNFYVPL